MCVSWKGLLKTRMNLEMAVLPTRCSGICSRRAVPRDCCLVPEKA